MKALTLASRNQSRSRPLSAAPVRRGTIGHDRNPDPSSMAAKPRNEACCADDLVIRDGVEDVLGDSLADAKAMRIGRRLAQVHHEIGDLCRQRMRQEQSLQPHRLLRDREGALGRAGDR
ncbi:hypothetical protein WR25_20010 [Diploscapter pachys]|uniref:Uncharacterized protein n=1 Tax=Diploscapter pachys TaxID=2018661 RepID=A0A2A2M531_9BILA|nr:hypothetical protein WR25_20010 [Diploscapter pachys]